MYLTFTSEGHETKTFTKNLISSEYAERKNMPTQVKNLFVPIGQDGVERKEAYTGEGLFFKLGCYNQTNGFFDCFDFYAALPFYFSALPNQAKHLKGLVLCFISGQKNIVSPDTGR